MTAPGDLNTPSTPWSGLWCND